MNPKNPPITSVFKVIGTGHVKKTFVGLSYIGTVHNPYYKLVWHLFEVNLPNKTQGINDYVRNIRKVR